jgi:acetyltransferase
VLVDSERELVDAVAALAVTRARPAADPGVGVVTAQAGPGLLLLDDLQGRQARIPELAAATRTTLADLLPPLTYQSNPVDTGRPSAQFGRVLAAVAADPGVDVLAGYALDEPDAVDLVAAAREAEDAAVPMVLGVGGTGEHAAHTRRALLDAGIAVARDPSGVAAATAALLADARARARARSTAAPPTADQTLPDVTGAYDEHQAKQLLGRLGVATPPRRACDSRAQAHAALEHLGAPVAVKLLDAAVLHKTEIGGVHLGVAGPHDLDTALDALERAGARRFLVEAMAPPGVDLVAGARRDPVFGPVILLGLGGTTAEALADVSIRLAPATPAEAAEMPAELAARALLTGWRGGPVLDTGELGRMLAALGALLAANPSLDEIEVNPLRLTVTGLVALDAVIICKEADDAHPDL